jgi:hypothetical protein
MQSGLWQCGQVITIMDALYKQRDKIHSQELNEKLIFSINDNNLRDKFHSIHNKCDHFK